MKDHLESVLEETRTFPPPAPFAASARVSSADDYADLHERSLDDPEAFWAEQAESLRWREPWNRVLAGEAPSYRWFEGGSLNVSENCLDRHLEGDRRHKAAIVWEGEPGEVRTLTYHQLHREVCRFAAGLRKLGVTRGDRVAIYLPMVPEMAVALLACARIGAVHSVVFAGFSAEALADRIRDCGAVCVLTADGGYRRGEVLPLKETVDEAVAGCPTVDEVVVLRRTGTDVSMTHGRDFWWDDIRMASAEACPPEPMDAEDPLFILYTSGTTGTPKGIVHTQAGYLLWTSLTHRLVFDLRETDLYWCTADVGWITGHSYIVYGPLCNGATVMMYEGAPDHPDRNRLWEIVQRHGVTTFYTAPTAIRTFIRWGSHHPLQHDLSSLRLLGTVGEPINPEAWVWYRKIIGGERCPIVDTWWQTETGGIMITTLPGALDQKPGAAGLPVPGVDPEVVDEEGNPVPEGKGGYLTIREPWPGMARTIWGDEERFREVYWSRFPGRYFTGDGARRDEDGYVWILGRVDDVLNVSGHRIGTAEVESALVSHDDVAEAAVVGRPDEVTGQAVCAFVTLKGDATDSDELAGELREWVSREIGSFARPADVRFTEVLPKTRSGKIMRRILGDIAAGRETEGDTSTLADEEVLARLRGEDEE